MPDYISFLRLFSCSCALLCAGMLHASGLQPWLRELAVIPPAPSAKEKDAWMRQVWTRTAEYAASLSEPASADDCGDAMVLLVPVFQAWPDGKAAGAALAEILSVPAESIGDVSSWDDLVKHQEAIQERVRFLRLKKLAAYYDSAAIRRAVKRNRDKYGERYAGAEGFLARLDEWEKELGPLDRWVEQAGPGQAALLREMVDLRRKALIEALPEQNGLKEWVSVRRFNPSGKSSFNHDRPANWQGISSMPGPGRRYRSGIVKFNGVSSSSPVEQLLADDRWVGHLDVDFSGEKLMFTGNGFGKKENRPWDVFELDLKTGKKESLTAHMPADTDSYNSCYLPDAGLFSSILPACMGCPAWPGWITWATSTFTTGKRKRPAGLPLTRTITGSPPCCRTAG